MRRVLLMLATMPSVMLTIAACVGNDPSVDDDGNADAASSADGAADSTALPDGANGNTDGAQDGPTSTGPCDLSKPFGLPTKLAEVSTNESDEYPRFASDSDELFVSRPVTVAGAPAGGIVQFLRFDGGAWGTPTQLAVNDIGDGGLMHSGGLTVTADGKTGFFSRTDKFGFGRGISKLIRTGPKQAWSTPSIVSVKDPAGQPAAAMSPWINADSTRLYYDANTGGPQKLYQAAFNAGSYGPATLIGSDGDDRNPVLSADEKRVYFASGRVHPSGATGLLVYTATRLSIDDGFGPAQFVEELNGGMMEIVPTWLSADGCTLVLSGRTTDSVTYTDVYVAKKP